MKRLLAILLTAGLLATAGCGKKQPTKPDNDPAVKKDQPDAPPTPAADPDLNKLAGPWVVERVEEKGKPVDERKGQQFCFLGPAFNIRDAQGKELAHGACRLDSSGPTRTLDLEHKKGDWADRNTPAIYQLDGDSLKICLAPPGAERPEQFATDAQSPATLLVLRRYKAEQPAPAGPVSPEAEMKKLQGTWVAVSVEAQGRPVPQASGRKFVFSPGKEGLQFSIRSPDGKSEAQGDCRLEAGGPHPNLDFLHTKEPLAGRTMRAIYAFTGNSLKLCTAPEGADRPTALATKAGSPFTLFILKREETIQAEAELARLIGTWVVTSVEENGKPVDKGKDWQYIFFDNQFNIKDEKGGEVAIGQCSPNPSATPTTMDLEHRSGRHKGQTALAIYQLDGDSLKICLAPPGAERPAKFAAPPGSSLTLLVLKRKSR